MGDKVWVQCQECGHLYKIKTKDISDDDLYIEIHCPRCRDETKHLWIGPNKEDVYFYGNVNVDPRYYQYDKTIQND